MAAKSFFLAFSTSFPFLPSLFQRRPRFGKRWQSEGARGEREGERERAEESDA